MRLRSWLPVAEGGSLNLVSWSWVAKGLLIYVKMIWPPAACA
jgi:hypothetical protein